MHSYCLKCFHGVGKFHEFVARVSEFTRYGNHSHCSAVLDLIWNPTWELADRSRLRHISQAGVTSVTISSPHDKWSSKEIKFCEEAKFGHWQSRDEFFGQNVLEDKDRRTE